MKPIAIQRNEKDQIIIRRVERFNSSLLKAVNDLLPQLTDSAPLLTASGLKEIIASETTQILVAVEGERIGGMLTLVLFRIPTGLRGWIEDVVVNKADRNKGVGRMLTEKAIEIARLKGAHSLDLTSRPARTAANRLYQKIGFKKRETNAYRITL